jgi:hypothetical protein
MERNRDKDTSTGFVASQEDMKEFDTSKLRPSLAKAHM